MNQMTNKQITALVAKLLDAGRNNITDAEVLSTANSFLADARAEERAYAEQKVKEMTAEFQCAARTIAKHAVRGDVNEDKVAIAIGFKDELIRAYNYFTEGDAAKEQIELLMKVRDAIEEMADKGVYAKTEFIPDYLTTAEIEDKAKMEVMHITDLVNRAVRSINRHVTESGDFNPPTYKITRVIGYKGKVAKLNIFFGNDTAKFANEIAQLNKIANYIVQFEGALAGDPNTKNFTAEWEEISAYPECVPCVCDCDIQQESENPNA